MHIIDHATFLQMKHAINEKKKKKKKLNAPSPSEK